MTDDRVVPLPALVMLIGPSGAGKSHWAEEHFVDGEVVSSDRLRAAVGLNEYDQDASADAFELLETIVERRLSRKLTTVVDTLGLDPDLRARMLEAARRHEMEAVAVVFGTPERLCRERNRTRTVPVPARVLTSQIRRYRQQRDDIAGEGWDSVVAVDQVVVVSDRPEEAMRSLPEREAGITFGLVVSSFPWPDHQIADTLSRVAGAAEEAGFTSLWLMDHLIQIPQVGRRWDPMLEGPTTLAWLAAVTSRIQVGPLVANTSLRHPAHLAKILATVDVLSYGRARCGLGAGWWGEEFTAYGMDLPEVGERMDRLEDALRLLPLMWGPGKTDYSGKTVRVVGAECYPRPVRGHIPVVVGGQGDRTLSLAARLGDGANLRGDPELVGEAIEAVEKNLVEADRDPARFEISHLSSPLVGKDRAEVAELRARFRRGASGTVDEHRGRVARLAEAGVETFLLASPDMADGVGAVERLAPLLDG